MIRKILIQTFICLILAFVLITAVNSKNDRIQKHAVRFIDHMSVMYTLEDAKGALKNTAEVFKPIYGEPIDQAYKGNETPVYAVGGGKVIAVGESEEIGRYIKIKHGDQAESLYGNLAEVHVIASSNVKKGQIIGIYEKAEGREFYYSFKEF